MPDSLLPPPSAQARGPAAAPGMPGRRTIRLPALAAALVFAACLPAAAVLLAWQMRASEHDLAALHLSAQLRVVASTLEQQARAALRESREGGPVPAWYAEELRQQAPACSRMIDALAARELPPALTGLERSVHFSPGEAASGRIEASAASWLAVRHQIEPALRPGSSDAALRAAAMTLEALGPMVVESSADLSHTLRQAMQARWRMLAAVQWTLAAVLALMAVLLSALAVQRRRATG